jgi:hypothetical protein
MPETRRLNLEEFQREPLPEGVEALLSQFNAGSFMACHKAVFEATGIWVDELVPVFERLDAILALRDKRPDAVR